MKLTFILLHCLLFHSAYSQTPKIVCTAEIKKPQVNDIEDLDLKLKLINYTNFAITIKKNLNIDYCEAYDTQICFYVEKLISKKYKQIFGTSNIDRYPMYDSLGNKVTDSYYFIEPNDSLVKVVNPMDVFSFTRGKYRLRIYIKFEHFTQSMQLFANSDWLYFNVISKSVIPIRKK